MAVTSEVLAAAFSIRKLNWLLLVLCIVIVILVSFFIFYWNRFLGWLLGRGLRFLWWKRYNMWIECQSIQFAFLAGRILLKDVQYHSSNMSIRVLHCHITWRYWLWKTQEGEDIQYDHAAGEEPEKSNQNKHAVELPCRVHVFMEGIEWFIYNRTPSYNAIIEKLGVPDVLGPDMGMNAPEDGPHSAPPATYPPTTASSSGPQSSLPDNTNNIWNRVRNAVWRVRMPEIDFNEILPVGLELRKGALVIGNDSTPTILIMDLAGGNGTYGISQSRSKFDEYKQIYDVQLNQVKVITRTNPDYCKRMLDRGKEVVDCLAGHPSNELLSGPAFLFDAYRQFTHRLDLPVDDPAIPSLSSRSQRQAKWGGLARYHTNSDNNEKAGVLHEPEYAKVTCLLETPALNIIYYADVAGKVPHRARPMPAELVDIGNGDEAPEWGVELELHGGPGCITYGPWADRQRVHWQQMLAPPSYQNTQPTTKLKSGDCRQSVSLRISVRFKDKDWRYDGHGDLDAQRRRHRRFGWLDLRIEADSFVKYTVPMVASREGFTATLEVDLKKIIASSSVNQFEFLRADRCTIRSIMPTPHKWNAERSWDVQVKLVKPSIKLLRDHINLFTDITKDWTSTPPLPDSAEEAKQMEAEGYNRFVPITYVLGVTLENYRLDLYANDHNIIDWPLSHVDNSILSLTGQTLGTNVSILSNEFRPEFSTIPFTITAPGVNLMLSMPKWNTHSAFATPRTSDIGHIRSFSISGAYTSYADVRPDAASNVVFKAFGWAIRHIMVVKENYFGMFTGFTMRNEFLTKLHSQNIGDPVREKYREGKSNPFEMNLGVLISDSLLVLPQEVYDCQAATALELSDLQVTLRGHEYGMEMSLNISPFTLSVVEGIEVLNKARNKEGEFKGCLKIEGLDIIAHRLFGPQPEVATYVCIWEIMVGEISGSLSISSVVGILASLRAFRINFADDFNAPAADFSPPALPDVTFLRVKCPLVDLTIGLGSILDDKTPSVQQTSHDSLLHFSLSKGFSIQLTDRPHPAHKSCMRFDIPAIGARILQRITGFHQTWFELAGISFDISGEKASAPLGWREHREAQLNFIRAQDASTQRIGFLYGSKLPPTRAPRHGGLTYLTPLKPPFGSADGKSRAGSVSESLFERKEYADSFRSEQDDVMTEASRDARVAKSRPVTPQVISGKTTSTFQPRASALDGEMSSGDESDNDMSEYEPSMNSSIGPFVDDEVSVQSPQWPFVDHYRQALRRYRPVHSGYNPDHETFCLKHDPTKSFHEPLEGDDAQLRRTVKRDVQDHEHTSSFGITVQHGLNITITPTCIPFICQLLTGLDTRSSALDLLADSILDEILDSPALNQSATAIRTTLDLDIPLTRIMFLQSIMSSTEADALSAQVHNPSAVPIHVDARVLALLDLEIRHTSCHLETLGGVSDRETTVCLKSTLIDTRLRKLVSKPFASSRHELEPSSDRLRLKFAGASLDLSITKSSYTGRANCNAFDMFISNKSPEILITALEASSHSFGELSSFWESRSKLLSRHRRYFMWAAMNRLRGQTIVADPFATNLPSFLVQTGRPGKLRSDPSWRTLTIVRQSVRQMGPVDREVLQSSLTDRGSTLPNKELDDLLPLMEQWTNLYGQGEQDPQKIPPILHELFPPAALGTPPLLFCGVFSLDCRRAKAILHSHEGDYNEFTVDNFNTHLRCSTMDYVPIENATAVSTESRKGEKALHIIGAISLHKLGLSVYPSCVLFVRQILFVQRQMTALGMDREKPTPNVQVTPLSFHHVVVELALSASSFSFAAPAQQITFEAQTSGCTSTISSIITLPNIPAPPRGSLSLNLTTGSVSLRACQRGSEKSGKSVLAGIELRNVMVHGAISEDPGILTQARLLLSLDQFKISVPRSVLRLYRFIDSWRREYLPAYDSMLQDLLSELDHNSRPSSSQYTPALFSGNLKIDLHTQLREFCTELHVMHGTWLTWNVLNSITFLDSKGLRESHFGHKIGSQVIHLTNGQPNSNRPASTSNSVHLELPSLRLEGKYPQLDVRLHVDRFSVTLKPQYFDDFLAIQHKFGNDFNELVDLAVQFKTQRETSPEENLRTPTTNTTFPKFDISFKFDGFRIGIEGPSSTQYLDSSTIKGQVHSGTQKRWSFGVESLALSLAHQSAPRRARTGFDRKYRSAYMVLDMSAHNVEYPEATQQENHLGVVVNFVHAVMQPAAIAELGDLIDHVQAEMLSRQEQRASELAEVRRKTRRVMRTLESNEQPHAARQTKTFLDNRKIEFTVKDIGIVFPLTLQDDLMLPQMGSSMIVPLSPSSVPAFLISLNSVSFLTQRYETGQAKIDSFSFQFVPGFDQSQPSHFKGNTHDTRNRMIYPSMEAEVQSTTTSTARQIWVRAIVSGFELDLEPSIVNYLFSIVDVYRQGRDRISKLATYATRSDTGSSTAHLPPPTPSTAQYSAVLTTNIKASFEFKSGRIRSHTPNVRANDHDRSQSLPTLSSDDETFEHGVDTLDLPMVSAWLEYKATPASQKILGISSPNQSVLVCNTTIHPIANVLRPSLLPFLTDISNRVQERLAHAPTPPRSPRVAPFSDLSTIHEGLSLDDDEAHEDSSPTGSMQVIFSLDVNKSTLELTCQPDVNVVAGLKWESGGFIITISPGAREVAVVGTLTSITAEIQHGYLNEDSVSAKAQNLTFSVDFRKIKGDEDAVINSVSVVVDTQIAGTMRFSRLQDLLCFKAVWLDRIPVFDSLVRPPPVHTTSVIKAELPGRNHIPPAQPFQTLVLVNIDKANIVADLGPTIARTTLNIESLTFRTRLCEEVSEATLTIAKLELLSERAVVGFIRTPDFVFHTVRRRHGRVYHNEGHAKMLELTLKSGDIESAIEYERQHLMHFHADPLHVTIFDDWSKVNSDIPFNEREVYLEFNIQAGDILAYSSTTTVPKMISLGGKLAALVNAQKQGAARESNAFRASQKSKPDTALSEVAAAMLQSARSKFKETETFEFAVIQRLNMSIKTLRLAVPPVTQLRTETALFSARQVDGRLHRIIRPHEPPCRDLLLELGAFSIRGVPQHSIPTMQMTARDIMAAFPYGTRVFLFPATRISMKTKQIGNKICYTFAINLADHVTGEKGIYVALSFASWNWLLGIKRKFETDLEAALNESVQSGKDVSPRPRGKSTDIEPGTRSTDDDAGTRTAYHSPAMTPRSQTPPPSSAPTSPRGAHIPISQPSINVISIQPIQGSRGLEYEESESQVSIDAPTLEVLGRATPDISNTPTFKGLKKALPTWVHEYTTLPIEEIMNVLLEVYSKQLRSTRSNSAGGQ